MPKLLALTRLIADDELAEQRYLEVRAVIDAFLAPLSGEQQQWPQLWQMAEREPPADWPPHAQLALRLCARVLKLAIDLVVECNQREATCTPEGRSSLAADLHPAQFLLPLLTRALCSVRYVQLGVWQKRVAWYTAQRLAECLSGTILNEPVEPPEFGADVS